MSPFSISRANFFQYCWMLQYFCPNVLGMVVVQTVPDFSDNLSTDHQKNIYLQTVIIDYAQRTSRSENPFLIVLKLVSNDPLYGLVINLARARWGSVLQRDWSEKWREASYWATARAWLYHEKYESIKTIYKWFLIFITQLSEMLQFKLTNIPSAILSESVVNCFETMKWTVVNSSFRYTLPLATTRHYEEELSIIIGMNYQAELNFR